MISAGSRIAVCALVALALCAGLAIAAYTSSPHQGTLKGQIKPSGHAKLRIHYRHTDGQNMRWYRWHFYRVPLKCKGGPAIARRAAKDGEGIWNRFADGASFGGTWAELDRPHHVTYREHVSGKLITPDKARGLVRVSGASVPLRGGGHDECDSGRLHWKVRR